MSVCHGLEEVKETEEKESVQLTEGRRTKAETRLANMNTDSTEEM